MGSQGRRLPPRERHRGALGWVSECRKRAAFADGRRAGAATATGRRAAFRLLLSELSVPEQAHVPRASQSYCQRTYRGWKGGVAGNAGGRAACGGARQTRGASAVRLTPGGRLGGGHRACACACRQLPDRRLSGPLQVKRGQRLRARVHGSRLRGGTRARASPPRHAKTPTIGLPTTDLPPHAYTLSPPTAVAAAAAAAGAAPAACMPWRGAKSLR